MGGGTKFEAQIKEFFFRIGEVSPGYVEHIWIISINDRWQVCCVVGVVVVKQF